MIIALITSSQSDRGSIVAIGIISCSLPLNRPPHCQTLAELVNIFGCSFLEALKNFEKTHIFKSL